MTKSCGIRLWAPALMVGVALCAFGVRLEAQAASSPQHPSAAAPPSVEPSPTPSPTQAASRANDSDHPAFNVRSAEAAAYQALNARRIDEAESRFKEILANKPGDPNALAGMGYVRMQQGNFLGAVSFLEQATQASPKDKAIAAALDTARFGFMVGEGRNALDINDLATAEKRYREALELRPDNPVALAGLGETLLREQQPGLAAPMLEHALAEEPNLAGAWGDLVRAQAQAGSAMLALSTDRQVPAPVHAQLLGDPLYLQALATAYSATGRPAEAQRALEAALALPFPANPSGAKAAIELQYADLLFAVRSFDQAREIYAEITAADHANTAAWVGLVRAEHALGKDDDAFTTFESMPAESSATAMRDPGFEATIAAVYRAENKLDDAQDLLEKAMTQQTGAGQKPSPEIELELADIYIQRGQPQLAYPIDQRVLAEHPDNPDAWAGLLSSLHLTGHDKEAIEQARLIPAATRTQLETNAIYLQTMAAVYGDEGHSREGSLFLDRAEQGYAAASKTPPSQVLIQNAHLLYNGMDDEGLYRQLMALGERTDLTDAERREVQTIWAQWAVRRAGQATAGGNTRRALDILNAAARSTPDDPAIARTLAGGYAQAGVPEQAVRIYKAQDMTKASAAEYESAVGAALAVGDDRDAEAWLRYALKAFPKDPQVLLLGAKFEQARGDNGRAIEYYRESLKAMPPPGPATKLTAELGLPAPSAAPTLPSPDHPQDLSVLLDPRNGEATPAGAANLPGSAPGAAPLPPYNSGGDGVVPPRAAYPLPQRQSQNGETAPLPAPQSSATGGEVYRPFVPYIAPPVPTPVPDTSRRTGTPSAVAVQLGNNAPPPVQPPSEQTDVLPTARYAGANSAAPADATMAAAQAERARRQRAGSAAAPTGQSHPASETSVAGPQVTQPAAPPAAKSSSIPNTGAQQYPQPSTPPRVAPRNQARAVPPPAPAPETIAPVATVQPELAQPAPAPPPPAAAEIPVPPINNAPPQLAPPTDAELAASNLPSLGGRYAGQAPMRQTPMRQTPRQSAEIALASIEGSYSGWLGATGVGGFRTGTAGMDRLIDVEGPVEASTIFARSLRLTAIALPAFLDSGTRNSAAFNPGALPYLGTLAANSAKALAQGNVAGIGGELQLTAKYVGIAAGYSPYEFLVHNITGRFRADLPGGHISVFAEREPVRETQLSYAGLRDPGTVGLGPIWGGVVATTGGGRLEFAARSGAGFYIAADGGVLTGRHVLDNNKIAGETGAYFRLGNWPSVGSLTIGGALNGAHFAHNEVGLTYGQGGYFSPGWYYTASAPVVFTAHHGDRFHSVLRGAVGVESFEQAQSPFFPLDPLLQSSFVTAGTPCANPQIPSLNCGQYPRTTTTAFSYSFDGQVSYRFAEQWYGGGFVAANNARNYDTVSAGFFLRYTFRSQRTSENRPTGLFPVDGLRPLQIP